MEESNWLIADFFLSTVFIPKRRLKRWIQRQGFGARKVLILKWMVMGSFLTMGYKSALLSALLQITYENTIDTIYDMDDSGLPLLIAKGTTTFKLFAEDQREVMRKIFDKSIGFDYNGVIPQWVLDMYKSKTFLTISNIKSRYFFQG